MRRRVIVVGSVNVDLVATVERLPAAGETVVAGCLEQHHGGKGANQAVAARRLGAAVEFVGAAGADPFGDAAVAALDAEGVGTRELRRHATQPTGVALILVDARGENMIAVVPGANAAVTLADVEGSLARLALGPDDVLVVSHEIPTAAARAALAFAERAGARSILNPAPAAGLDRATFGRADLLTPNRAELATLAADEARRTGRAAAAGEGPERQARRLLEPSPEGPGPRLGIVATLGPAGALLVAREGAATAAGALLVAREGAATAARVFPAARIVPVDATGAGDAFTGALAAWLAEGRPLEESIRRAVVAAGLATTKSGAREGMPTARDLEAALVG